MECRVVGDGHASQLQVRAKSANSSCEIEWRGQQSIQPSDLFEMEVECMLSEYTPFRLAIVSVPPLLDFAEAQLELHGEERVPLLAAGAITVLLNGSETLVVPCHFFENSIVTLDSGENLQLDSMAIDSFALCNHDKTCLDLHFNDSHAGLCSIEIPKAEVLSPLCTILRSPTDPNPCPLTMIYSVEIKVSKNGSLLEPLNSQSPSFSCPPTCSETVDQAEIAIIDVCPGFVRGQDCYSPSSGDMCSFGEGLDCKECPEHARCPGGFRAWPVAGYWAKDGSTGEIHSCPPPSKVRCLGWDAVSGATICGPGYDHDSPLCGSCLENYRSLDGVCIPCPRLVDATEEPGLSGSAAFGLFVAFLVVVYATCSTLLTRAFRISQLPVSKGLGFRIAGDVCIWLINTLQVLIQLTRLRAAGIPKFLRQLFGFFQALEADFAILFPYECAGESPFFDMYVVNIAAISLTFLSLSMSFIWIALSKQKSVSASERTKCTGLFIAWVHFACAVCSTLLYGPSLSKSLSTLDCEEAPSLADGEGTTHIHLVWAHDTRVECYESPHSLAVLVAGLALVVVGLGVPLHLLGFAWWRLRLEVKSSAQANQSISRPCACTCRPTNSCRQNKTVNRSGKHRSVCSMIFCSRLREKTHAKLRGERQWAAVFGFGQPWLRPVVVGLVALVSLVSWLLDVDKWPIARCVVLSILLIGATVIMLWPTISTDHRWGQWKRYPRGFVYAASAALVLFQTIVVATEGASPMIVPLSWILVLIVCVLPVTVFFGLFRWLGHMVNLNDVFCPCYGARQSRQRRLAVCNGVELVQFLCSLESEAKVKGLVGRYGLHSVARAVESSDFKASISKQEANLVQEELLQRSISDPSKLITQREDSCVFISRIPDELWSNSKINPLARAYREQRQKSSPEHKIIAQPLEVEGGVVAWETPQPMAPEQVDSDSTTSWERDGTTHFRPAREPAQRELAAGGGKRFHWKQALRNKNAGYFIRQRVKEYATALRGQSRPLAEGEERGSLPLITTNEEPSRKESDEEFSTHQVAFDSEQQ